jgi:hypothetical protein
MALFRLQIILPRTSTGKGDEGRTLASDHVCDLDHGVHLSFGKYTFPAGAFNIEAKDSQRGNVGPIIFRRVRCESIVSVQRLLTAVRGKQKKLHTAY